jgi:hypothetical protein
MGDLMKLVFAVGEQLEVHGVVGLVDTVPTALWRPFEWHFDNTVMTCEHCDMVLREAMMPHCYAAVDLFQVQAARRKNSVLVHRKNAQCFLVPSEDRSGMLIV